MIGGNASEVILRVKAFHNQMLPSNETRSIFHFNSTYSLTSTSPTILPSPTKTTSFSMQQTAGTGSQQTGQNFCDKKLVVCIVVPIVAVVVVLLLICGVICVCCYCRKSKTKPEVKDIKMLRFDESDESDSSDEENVDWFEQLTNEPFENHRQKPLPTPPPNLYFQ